MSNPFDEPLHRVNYAQFLREQIADMNINESKFVFSADRSQQGFASALFKATPMRFRTKKDQSRVDGYWVQRIS